MSLPLYKQSFEILKRSKRPVVVLPHNCGEDGYASALALSHVCKKMNIPLDIVAADGVLPQCLAFLKPIERVRGAFGQLQKFVVTLKVDKTKLEELSYDIEGDELHIYLTPRSGFWTEKDLGSKTSSYKYDLIISIGSANLESLGKIFLDNSAFFYNTPILNIDHMPENEHFGQINVVDLTSTSNGEVLYQMLNSWDGNLINEHISTHLLTGMISKTQSFKSANVTPKTLQNASVLLKKGGRREEIVDNLFRTRSVETLRLWGRVLARLKSESSVKLVWSIISSQDFVHSGAGEEELPDVIEELIRNAPEAEVVVLLYEDKEKHVCGIVSSGRGMDSLELALPFKPNGTRDIARICFTDRSITEAEKTVIPKLIERIKERQLA
ncbi:hypothetical protein HQ524_01165 [Candidatus Uhrbacteria bacterium]|nr:hypothetical protein [Candidatus Uhrbacteria bacterium]